MKNSPDTKNMTRVKFDRRALTKCAVWSLAAWNTSFQEEQGWQLIPSSWETCQNDCLPKKPARNDLTETQTKIRIQVVTTLAFSELFSYECGLGDGLTIIKSWIRINKKTKTSGGGLGCTLSICSRFMRPSKFLYTKWEGNLNLQQARIRPPNVERKFSITWEHSIAPCFKPMVSCVLLGFLVF